jgi:hypothetical protein
MGMHNGLWVYECIILLLLLAMVYGWHECIVLHLLLECVHLPFQKARFGAILFGCEV